MVLSLPPLPFPNRSYIDGRGVCSAAPAPLPVRGSPLFIGAASSTLLNPFCGMVYDVRVYSRALPPVELRPLWGEMSHRQQVCTRVRGVGAVNVNVNELRLGFSSTTRNPEGIISHNNRKS
jgi:hypothetical protein